MSRTHLRRKVLRLVCGVFEDVDGADDANAAAGTHVRDHDVPAIAQQLRHPFLLRVGRDDGMEEAQLGRMRTEHGTGAVHVDRRGHWVAVGIGAEPGRRDELEQRRADAHIGQRRIEVALGRSQRRILPARQHRLPRSKDVGYIAERTQLRRFVLGHREAERSAQRRRAEVGRVQRRDGHTQRDRRVDLVRKGKIAADLTLVDDCFGAGVVVERQQAASFGQDGLDELPGRVALGQAATVREKVGDVLPHGCVHVERGARIDERVHLRGVEALRMMRGERMVSRGIHCVFDNLARQIPDAQDDGAAQQRQQHHSSDRTAVQSTAARALLCGAIDWDGRLVEDERLLLLCVHVAAMIGLGGLNSARLEMKLGKSRVQSGSGSGSTPCGRAAATKSSRCRPESTTMEEAHQGASARTNTQKAQSAENHA
ncbi:hypothetical protein L1887_43304 [Cichorium endivia]|nr:hypothetical protein L1887_43304 [Cichorium endivia]